MDNELVFENDCVIRLEDLDDLKDYSDTIAELTPALKDYNQKINSQLPESFWEIIQADPEDTFFVPSFQSLLKTIIAINWQSKQLSNLERLKILQFYMSVLYDCLLSMTFPEELIDQLLVKIMQQKKNDDLQKVVLKLLFKLCDKIYYIEDFKNISLLWDIIEEEVIFPAWGSEKADIIAAIYCQCCQKYLRNKQIRKLLQKTNLKSYLQLKISLINKNKSQSHESLFHLKQKAYYSSSFLQKMCHYIESTLSS